MEAINTVLPVLLIACATQLAKLLKLPQGLVIPLVFVLSLGYVLLLRYDADLLGDALEILGVTVAAMGSYDASKYLVNLAIPKKE